MSLLINMWAFIVSWNKWNCNVRLRICVADFTFHCVLDNCVIFIVVFWDSRSYSTVRGEAYQEGSWGYGPPLIQNNVSEASLFLASVWHWLLFLLDTSSTNHESLLWIHVNVTCSSFYQWMGGNKFKVLLETEGAEKSLRITMSADGPLIQDCSCVLTPISEATFSKDPGVTK